MKHRKATAFVQELIRDRLKPGDIAVDATCGNGHDTLALARAVGPQGLVYAADIQLSAIDAARRRLADHGPAVASVRWIEACHSTLRARLEPEHLGHVAMTTFNFGYLPGGDKNLTTQCASSLQAVQASLDWTAPGGLVSLAMYPGHPEGAKEASTLDAWARSLDPRHYVALEYRFLNLINSPPFVIAIERADV